VAAQVDDITRLGAATANRLRLLQAEFADEPGDSRRGYLVEEVKRALDKIVPDKRQAFLRELSGRFPTWSAAPAPGAAAPLPKAGVDEKLLKDPNYLVGRLVEIAPALTQQQRQAAVERLAAAKLVKVEAPASAPASQQGPPAGIHDELSRKLGIAPGKQLDAEQALKLLELLIGFTTSLDQLVWKTWHQIAPHSPIRAGSALGPAIKGCMTGQQNVADVRVAGSVEKLRKATAALLAAVSQAGVSARLHMATLAPSRIRDMINASGVGILESRDVKCWKKYAELFETMETSIEADVIGAIAEYAGSLLKGPEDTGR